MDNINKFSLFLEEDKDQKPNTIANNIIVMRKILRETNGLENDAAKSFIKELIRNKTAPSYLMQQVCLIRQWGECFGDDELKNTPYPKKLKYRSHYEAAILSDEETMDFLSLPNPHKSGTFWHKRYEMWIFFFSVVWYHGMRTIEAARLTVDMVNFGLEVFDLPEEVTKTSDPRQVPFAPDMIPQIKEYIQNLEGEYLFPSHHHIAKQKGVLHVTDSAWGEFFTKQIQRLGIKRKNLKAYSARHAWGTRQAEEGVHLSKIKKMMGHRKISTTEKYVHIGLKSLREVQNNDRIRNFLKNGQEMLQDIYSKQHELEEKYKEKIYTLIAISEDGKELNVKFKVRDQLKLATFFVCINSFINLL